jgi:hypothetical protein
MVQHMPHLNIGPFSGVARASLGPQKYQKPRPEGRGGVMRKKKDSAREGEVWESGG